MANFRGIGDDVKDVVAEQNRTAIALNELAQRGREHKDKMQLEREQMGARKEEVAARTAEDARQFDATQQARAGEFDQEYKLKLEEGRRNSERFSMAKTEWEAQDAKRRESLKLQEGAFADMIRASLFMPAAPAGYVRKANESMGLDDKANGAILGTFHLTDKTGFSYGVGYMTRGPDGKPVKNIITPEQVWQFMGKYSPEDQKRISEEYAKAYDQNSPMNVARVKHMEAYAKYYEEGAAAGQKAPVFPAEQEKALAAEQLRLETSLTDKTMLRDDVEKTKTAIAEIAAARKSILGVGAPAAGAKSASKSPSFRIEKGSIIIEENGAMGTLDDTPANRAELKAMGYDL